MHPILLTKKFKKSKKFANKILLLFWLDWDYLILLAVRMYFLI